MPRKTTRNPPSSPTTSPHRWVDRDCPPCFNCQLDAFQCQQFSDCNKYNGKCSCPPGFGGEDCSQPLCGSLADGDNRSPRKGKSCDCKEGWEGINCNVCKTDDACNALMPEGEGGVCYKQGLVVKQNYQMCDVTNRKILDQLKEQKPQVTFSVRLRMRLVTSSVSCTDTLSAPFVVN